MNAKVVNDDPIDIQHLLKMCSRNKELAHVRLRSTWPPGSLTTALVLAEQEPQQYFKWAELQLRTITVKKLDLAGSTTHFTLPQTILTSKCNINNWTMQGNLLGPGNGGRRRKK